MVDETVVVPHSDSEGFVALSESDGRRLFRKAILRVGESFVHPANPDMKITVDKTFAQKLVDNFKSGVCDIVQFPMVNDKNQHVETPSANLGRVVDLSYDDSGVYATIDVLKNADDIGKTILGASAMMNLDYVDTMTGEKKGPTLLHVAATNRPYLTNLGPFEAVALSNYNEECTVLSRVETTGDESETESENPMTLDELLAILKQDYDIDVKSLQEKAAAEAPEEPAGEVEDEPTDEPDEDEPADEEDAPGEEEPAGEVEEETPAVSDEQAEALLASLSNVLRAANPNLVALSNASDTLTIEELAGGIVELSNGYKAMSTRVESLEHDKAVAEVETAVSEGRILPVQRDAMLELRLSNVDLYNKLLPEEAVVQLSASGVTSHESAFAGEDVEQERTNLVTEMSRIANKTYKS